MFVAAWSRAATEVVYRAEDGSETIRSGGSRSWRNFNPGNIVKGSFADSCGAIGGDSRFAVFPDEATGHSAIVTLLTGRSYAGLTIEKAIYRYAPPTDNNDSEAYVAAVTQQMGVPPTTVVSTLSPDQLSAMADAIKRHEGWTPGTTAPFEDTMPSSLLAGSAGRPAGGLLQPVALDLARPGRAGDADVVPKLVKIGASSEACGEVRQRAFAAMAKIYGKPTPHNACACTLSLFLREAGLDVGIEYNAGHLARVLENARGWRRTPVGMQRAGDVAVAMDNVSLGHVNHIFLVVESFDADRMLIADNQTDSCPHERFASGKGRTPVAYFLRAGASGPGEAPALMAGPDDGLAADTVDQDEDTNSFPIAFGAVGGPGAPGAGTLSA